MKLAYLGPQGTFTEAAVIQVAATGDELLPLSSVDAALTALRDGDVDRAVVPIENSVEGGVPQTLDSLGSGSSLMVVREMLVPITFVLAARAGTRAADVRTVSSHPHGWAQCRGRVADNLPLATYVPALSTAAAAAGASEVPADTTSTSPWPSGSGPSTAVRATSSTSAAGSSARTAARAASSSRVASTALAGSFACSVVRAPTTCSGVLPPP